MCIYLGRRGFTGNRKLVEQTRIELERPLVKAL